jgi:hypothetical protein
MDRYINQDEGAFQPGRVKLDIQFTAGTSGAVPTTFSAFTIADGLDGSLTTPMTLTGTGVYTCLLADAYVRLLSAKFSVIQATYNAAHGQEGYVITNSVTDATTPAVAFQCTRPDTGAAVAVTSGDVVCITLELQRMTGDQ